MKISKSILLLAALLLTANFAGAKPAAKSGKQTSPGALVASEEISIDIHRTLE